MTQRKADRQARHIELAGHVQGVGFRPFVYRLANELGLAGWVRNEVGRVTIHAEGAADSLDRFRRGLVDSPPPLAGPRIGGGNTITEPAG